MSKKQKLGKSPIVSFFEAMDQNKRIKEQFVNLSNFKLGCDPAIAGGDKTAEYFVYRIANEYNMPHIYEKIKGASISIDKLSEQLNKLKYNEAMKITEDTKIKDLIPEGYDFNPESPMEYFKSSCNVTIPVKKKEVKDFKWYREKYIELNPYFVQTQIVRLNMIKNNFNLVPFEFKIGLLKFICDDLNICLYNQIHVGLDGSIKLKEICPPEFLNSIFN